MVLETVKLIVTLLGVLGLIYLLWYLARRFSLTAGNSVRLGRGLSVVERLPLTQDKSLAVVKAGNRMLLLGLSAQRVELITELDPEEWQMFSEVSSGTVSGNQAAARTNSREPVDSESADSESADSESADSGESADNSDPSADTENDPVANLNGVPMKQRDAVWNVSAGAIRGGSFQDGYSCLLDKNPSGWKKFLYCLKLALVQHHMLKPFIPKKFRERVEAQLPFYQKAAREQRGGRDFERLLEDEQKKRKFDEDREKK